MVAWSVRPSKLARIILGASIFVIAATTMTDTSDARRRKRGAKKVAWLAPPNAQKLPPIRISAANRVPACVTPDRLMAFLADRNPRLYPQFKRIAYYYRQHGEAWRVRWDYAFFQMLLETNFLSYKTGGGRWGDVRISQNNFAGIGTTGGGVPGDAFPTVSAGVLGQIQHLVAYSGERVAKPVAKRTADMQDQIIAISLRLGRTVTFNDLTRRWAVDRRYGRSIAWVADRFFSKYCNGRDSEPTVVAETRKPKPSIKPSPERIKLATARPDEKAAPSARRLPAPDGTPGIGGTAAVKVGLRTISPPHVPAPAADPAKCRVWTASYGGEKAILIKSTRDDEVHYTALQVLDGFEQTMADTYIDVHAKGGAPIGRYPSKRDALIKAFELCPVK